MANVASLVLATLNAPYGANLTTHQLAALIAEPQSAINFSAPVFSFFSEVSPALQQEFIDEMGADLEKVSVVANLMSKLSGYALPLAA
tara:strand:+ start:2902 stop:3165 length:264 start_codon:yes stop_codon:yes gene_type:complete